MSRTKHSDEFEIEVGGEAYVWRLHSRPQCSSDPKERRGMGIAVRHGEGQREAVLEFPPGPQPRFGLRQLQAAQVPVELVRRGIGAALAAGWEPHSRGKTEVFAVDAEGN